MAESQVSDHDKAVNEIANVLKQLVRVSPQQLYEAAVQVYSELAIESMQAEMLGKLSDKAVHTKRIRAAMCMTLATILLQSGLARMTQEDIAAMSLLMKKE